MAAAETTIPSGRTAQPMRLTYPAKWRSEAAAKRFVEDNGLWAAGVALAQAAGAWRIVIDTDRAAMITPWLRQRFPGVAWDVSWTPKP
jgi:hypothetical protein